MSIDFLSDNVEKTVEVQDIVLMTNPRANYVSLVDRGANKTPWRVVKNYKGESGMRVLQTVLAPAGTSVEAIQGALPDVGTALKLDMSVDKGPFVSFEQAPRDVFKSESFELVILDEALGLKGLVGEPKEVQEGSFVTKLFKPKQSFIEVDAPAIPFAVASRMFSGEFVNQMAEVEKSFIQLFQEEGSVQEKVEKSQKILAGFGEFVKEAISITDGKLHIEKDEKENKDMPNTTAEKGFEFDAEEFPECMESADKQACVEAQKKMRLKEAEKEKIEKQEKDDANFRFIRDSIEAISKRLVDLENVIDDRVGTLEDELEGIQKSAGIVGSRTYDEVVVKKAKEDPADFSGLLFR